MECPNCKEPILKSFKRCPECGVNLIELKHEKEAERLAKELAEEKVKRVAAEAALIEAQRNMSRLP